MPPEELWSRLHRRPFNPFRIHLSDGSYYDVRHPDLMIVGHRSAVIGIKRSEESSPEDKPLLYDYSATLALMRVVRLEPLEAATGST
jgi:hypothetical protein